MLILPLSAPNLFRPPPPSDGSALIPEAVPHLSMHFHTRARLTSVAAKIAPRWCILDFWLGRQFNSCYRRSKEKFSSPLLQHETAKILMLKMATELEGLIARLVLLAACAGDEGEFQDNMCRWPVTAHVCVVRESRLTIFKAAPCISCLLLYSSF